MSGLNSPSAVTIALVAALSACGTHGGNASAVSDRSGSMVGVRSVVASLQPNLNGQNIVTFAVAPPGMDPTTVALGSDGNIWFAQMVPYIGRLTPGGTITEFAIPSGHFANDITPGAFDTLWFSEFEPQR